MFKEFIKSAIPLKCSIVDKGYTLENTCFLGVYKLVKNKEILKIGKLQDLVKLTQST